MRKETNVANQLCLKTQLFLIFLFYGNA